MDSKKGLSGATDLGIYRIRLEKVRSVEVLDFAAASAAASIAPIGGLRVEDIEGNRVELIGNKANRAKIDYTFYSVMYYPDFEYSGIRAYEGEGIITVAWAYIDKVLIGNKKTDVKPYRLAGQIALKNGQTKKVDLKMGSQKGLSGAVDLGIYRIRLEQLRSIEVLGEGVESLAAPASIGAGPIGGLRVEDTEGNSFEFIRSKSKVGIDYTAYPKFGVYTLDIEHSGIRVNRGVGIVLVEWRRVESVSILHNNIRVGPHRLAGRIVLKNGLNKEVDLKMDSKKGLAGETVAGKRTIRLKKVRFIEVF